MFNCLWKFSAQNEKNGKTIYKPDPHILDWIKITDSSLQNNSAAIIEQSSEVVHSQIAM